MTRRIPVLLLAAGIAAGPFLLSGLSEPRPAAADQGTLTVGDAAEAWYNTGSFGSCSSPVGCPPVTVPSNLGYPSDTLHVAYTAGQMTAATYVQPDLSTVPAGQTPAAGTMTLPLDTTNGSGSFNTSAATMEACLATKAFTDGTEGSSQAPPSVDCSVKAPVTVGTSEFTLNLTPFLGAWAAGRPEDGIALMADPASTPSSSWHVTFNGRRLANAAHITSVLSLGSSSAVAASPGSEASPGAGAAAGGSNGTPVSGAVSSSGGPISPTAAAGESALASPAPLPVTAGAGALPLQLAGQAPTGASPAARASGIPAASSANAAANGLRDEPAAGRGGFQYPEVMLLPLLFGAGLIFVVRLLTADATPGRKAI